MTVQDERKVEQEYFDRAREARERRRHDVGDVAKGMAHARAAQAGRRHAEDVREILGDPDDAVALGRLDLEDDEEPLYIGKHLIRSERGDPLVVSWKAPIANAYYRATIRSPLGARRKRTYDCDRNRIKEFQDLVFRDLIDKVGSLQAGERPDLDDALLADLNRGRSGEMQDIVRTIQAAQYELMEAPLDQILVVQGGPGTGKTVVALHRVSWLLFNHTDELTAEDVLVVGPNRTFVRYIQQVLPDLGDKRVVQRDLSQLGPQVSTGRSEPVEVTRIKGDLRMQSVLDQGLMDRVLVPTSDLEVRTPNRTMTVPEAALSQRIAVLRLSPYNSGRSQLRDWARTTLQVQYGELPPATALDQALDRVWPQLSAPAFLQDLLGSQDRLLRTAGDVLTARDVGLLYRQSAANLGLEEWAAADLPLLDHVESAMNGETVERFRHIVVDEAQDLSPMQLASLARRASHCSMTLLGDIAQSTTAWTRDSWDEVLPQLVASTPGDGDGRVAELEFGYRVPAQVFELAAQLLPVVAPNVTAPKVVRRGIAEPILLKEDVDDIAGRAAEQARDFGGRGYMVGIICPDSRRADMGDAMRRREMIWRDSVKDGLASGYNLMSPETAKGLEFDAAIVAFPEEIVGTDVRVGGRLLYISMTRCTQQLAVVHHSTFDGGVLTLTEPAVLADGPAEHLDDGGLWAPAHVQDALPLTGSAPPTEVTRPSAGRPRAGGVGPGSPTPAAVPRIIRAVAEQLAEEIRGSLRPEQIPLLLAELQRLLEPAPDRKD